MLSTFCEGVNNYVSLDFFLSRFLPTIISRKPSIYKGLWALPTPGLWNKIGFCGNTMDADGIRLGTAALFYCALPQAFLTEPNFYFTDTVSAALHRGQ